MNEMISKFKLNLVTEFIVTLSRSRITSPYIFLADCYFEPLLKISLYFFAVPLLINTLESKYNIGSVSHVTHSHQYKRHIGGWERLMT